MRVVIWRLCTADALSSVTSSNHYIANRSPFRGCVNECILTQVTDVMASICYDGKETKEPLWLVQTSTMQKCVIILYMLKKNKISITFTYCGRQLLQKHGIRMCFCMVPTNLISQILHDVCDNLVSVPPTNEGQPPGMGLSSQEMEGCSWCGC